LFFSKEAGLLAAQFDHLRENLSSFFLCESSSPAWAGHTADSDAAAALTLKELQSPAAEVLNGFLEPLDLVVAEFELLPHQIVETGLDSDLHVGALPAAASLGEESLGANHQEGRV